MMLDLSVVCCPIWKSFLICCFKIFFRGFKFHKLNKLNRAVNVANDDVVETSNWGEHKVKNFFVLLSNPTDLQLPRQVLQTSRNCLMFALINAHHTSMPRRSYTSRSAIEAAIAECKIDREVKLINEIHFKVIVKVTERLLSLSISRRENNYKLRNALEFPYKVKRRAKPFKIIKVARS